MTGWAVVTAPVAVTGWAGVTGRVSDRPAGVTSALDLRRRSCGQRGSATVVMLGVIAVVLTLTVSGLLLASAVLASHRARAAVDLAALAAAGVLIRGESAAVACDCAARVASANYGSVQYCLASGTEVQLTVTVTSGIEGLGVATARSRAGPGPRRS